MGPGGGLGMGWVWLWWLLILVGVVAIVVALVRGGAFGGRSSRPDDRASSPDRPVSKARQILDERYARGEIDDEEYRARRRALDG
ncbi:SHOCT domain-containing protein [Intrasporangium sp.]|uniref:SHOCT domain-containing protein n=1 Tax=Intrasporangium sp. TaxID=1925024 RepID=UPI00293ACB15|nr:SHOCT domain-containing protein [Intrasporangium sp.]MDV3222720.1 SHOCT domain-containing protein [Intrasporangium sp.]